MNIVNEHTKRNNSSNETHLKNGKNIYHQDKERTMSPPLLTFVQGRAQDFYRGRGADQVRVDITVVTFKWACAGFSEGR